MLTSNEKVKFRDYDLYISTIINDCLQISKALKIKLYYLKKFNRLLIIDQVAFAYHLSGQNMLT